MHPTYREDSTEKRAQDGSTTENRTDDALIYRSFMQRHRIHDDDDRAGNYPSGAQPGNGPSDDEHRRTWSCSTECGADLEDGNGGQKDPFRRIEGVDSAEDELEGTARDEIGTGVPTDIAQRIKLVADGRYLAPL